MAQNSKNWKTGNGRLQHGPGYMRSRDRHFPGTPPASTLMIVTGFTRPEFLAEIEAVAAAL